MNANRVRTRPAAASRGRTYAVAYLSVAAVGTAAYWVVFFTSGAVQVTEDPGYLAFERAFPLADGWMAACALLGAIGLARGRPWGWFFGLLAGSSLVFLGCMDVLYNLNEGTYAVASAAMWAEVAINAFCLLGAPLLIGHLWRTRDCLA
ncbi:MAG: hypothetical protein FIB04_11230 [Gammaproteobacteria bacterium]|nr:hypothetical protein [Gammaproteobacteria bacterium]